MKEKLTIVKVGGKVVEEEQSLKALLDSFAAVQGHKMLVHGGGRSATKVAQDLGVEVTMIDGRRVTNKDMLEVVTMVYGGLVNKKVVAQLQASGVNAVGLTGADLNVIAAHKRPVKDIDYGFVGDIDSVQTPVLSNLIKQDVVPVMAPLTHDGKGSMLNTNADTIASELARALSEQFDVTLYFCFEKPGVLLNPDDDNSVIDALNHDTFKDYQQQGIISDGMIPKLDNGFASLNKGVSEIVIGNVAGLSTGNGTALKL